MNIDTNDIIIAIDGCDGCGKATQTGLLQKWFESMEIPNVLCSFPNYENGSSKLVRMYLNGEIYSNLGDSNPYATSMYYALDRHITIEQGLNRLRGNGVILCDRYTGSNAIHQMVKFNEQEWDSYIDWLYDLECNKLGVRNADATIYLHLSEKTADRLMTERYDGNEEKKDLHESDLAYMRACRKSGIYAAKKLGWGVIDCEDENGNLYSIEEIHTRIKAMLIERYNIYNLLQERGLKHED